ncbi:hypothetical protein [Demequina sp. SO4-18]|uniref:hypothetical protein n=1 Tax=Demequina sp. SO4-18 TaxID=3401026 RepID=UPI003B59C196
MRVRSVAVGTVGTLVTLGVLSGCASDASSEAAPQVTVTVEAPAPTVTVTPAETAAPVDTTPTAEAGSDIQVAVEAFTTALDDLGIEYTEPVRAEVGLSGAQARFDMTINGFDSGINVFGDPDTLALWQETSDSLGGIHVAVDNSVLSLNSSGGIATSAEIAPEIAEAVGGEARGI